MGHTPALTDERAEKHRRLSDFLAARGVEAALLARRCNVNWYTGGLARNYVGTADDAGVSTLLVTREGAAVIANNIEATRLAAEDLPGTGIQLVEYAWDDTAARVRAFERALGGRRAGADVPLAGVRADPLPAEFNRLRWPLLGPEVERYRRVAADTVAAVEESARAAAPGQTEDDLAGMLAAALRRRGLLPWVLLVGSDERVARFRHPLPTPKRVERHFMLATCAERGGLIAAVTRIASFGGVSADLEARHEAVATVEAALLAATRPGRTLGDCFAEAQAAYRAAGFPDEWRHHHQGGSIGYLPREAKAAPGDPTPILQDQAFAWNPTVAGTKGEDTVLCRADRTEPLAGPTDWPTVAAEWRGSCVNRPAILVR
jgi:antitoxin VapB